MAVSYTHLSFTIFPERPLNFSATKSGNSIYLSPAYDFGGLMTHLLFSSRTIAWVTWDVYKRQVPDVAPRYSEALNHRPVCSHPSAFCSGSEWVSGCVYNTYAEKPAWTAAAVCVHFQSPMSPAGWNDIICSNYINKNNNSYKDNCIAFRAFIITFFCMCQ